MPTPEQIEKARKAAPPFWRDTDQCEKYITKMLSAAEGVKPRVKPLEWEDTGEAWSRCDSVAGEYFIAGHQGRYAWSVDDDDAWHHGEHVESMEAAKALAQADYEARILSALQEGE